MSCYFNLLFAVNSELVLDNRQSPKKWFFMKYINQIHKEYTFYSLFCCLQVVVSPAGCVEKNGRKYTVYPTFWIEYVVVNRKFCFIFMYGAVGILTEMEDFFSGILNYFCMRFQTFFFNAKYNL